MMRRLFTHAMLFAAMVLGGMSVSAQTVTVTNTNPYLETFDNLTICSTTSSAACPLGAGWTNLSSATLDWRTYNNPTTSGNLTGPTHDFTTCGTAACPRGTGTGVYVYCETSSPSAAGTTYEMSSPTFDITTLNAPTMTFYYHMHGNNIGTMEVFVDNGTTSTLAWSLTGAQQTSESDAWRQATVDLCGYGSTVTLRFKYANGNTGTSFYGDAAIDQVEVKAGSITPTDVALSGLGAAIACPGPLTLPAVSVGNKGSNAISGVVVNWTVNGVAQPSVSVPGTLAPCGSANINLGTITTAAGQATNVKAWVDITGDGNQTNDTVSNAYIPSLAGTFTVNSAQPTGGTNANSLSDMASVLESAGVCGPVIINVVSGSGPYNEKVNMGEIPGASSTNTITINGNGERMVFNGGSGDRAGFWLNGADWVTIDNLEIDGSASTLGFGIHLTSQADNNTIKNCTIKMSSSTTSSLCTGISASGSPTSATSGGNSANNTLVENNRIEGSGYAITFTGSGTTSFSNGNTIRNNVATNYGFYGGRSYYQDNVTWTGNEFTQGTVNTTSGYGLYTFYSSHPTITYNKFIGWATYGIYLSSANSTSTGVNDRGLVANNFIADNGRGNGFDYGIYLASTISRNMDIYFNSINMTATSGTRYGIYVIGSNSANRANIVNNAISVLSNGSTRALYVTNTSYVNTVNNNGYYAPNSNFFVRVGSVDYNDGNFIGGGGYNANSVEGNPQFISATDLHSLGASIESKGVTIAGLSKDIDGQDRCPATGCIGGGSAPDIGADEFDIPDNDAAVLDIDRAAICAGTNTVMVEVGNFGSKPLGTVTLTATVNGTGTTLSGRKIRISPPLLSGQKGFVSVGTATFVGGTNYTIIATASAPNGRPDPNAGNDSQTITGMPALNGNFMVGAGGDYPDLTSAISALTSIGVCGPVVFAVDGGTYSGSFNLSGVNGTSATNTVTIKPQAGETVNINWDPTSTANNYVFQFDGASWVTIEDMNLTNTDAGAFGRVINFLGANDHITIENCTLTTQSTNASTSTNMYTVYDASAAGTGVNNLTFRNNTVDGSDGAGALYIYGSSSAEQEGLIIENNTITDFGRYGIYYPYWTDVTIKNNVIKNIPGYTSLAYGLYSFNSTLNSPVANEISGNEVVLYGGSTMYGIYFSAFTGNTAGSPALVANNMVSLINSRATSTTVGMYVTNCGNFNVYHNSIMVNAGSRTNARGFWLAGFSSGTKYGNHRIINNSFVSLSNALAVEIASGQPATNTAYVAIWNFNNIYSESGNIGEFANGAHADLASWQNVSGHDGGSVSVDPGYVGQDDLHANSIDLNSTGFPIGLGVDIDGDIRCPLPGCKDGGNAPDIGADEFEVPPTDLIPSMVVSPSEDGFGCNQNAATPVLIEIANNGSQALDFTVNPATVSWSAGGQTGSVTLNTGGIPVRGSQVVTVGAVDLSIGGTYSFDVTATVAGDMKTANDMLMGAATVVSRDPISTFPYIEDFNDFPTCISSAFTPCPLPAASGWVNETDDGHDWIVFQGDAPGTTTGPATDFDGDGRYMYVEYLFQSRAVLTSPCIELPTNAGACPFFTFAYHAYVSSTNSFEVQINDGSGWQTEFFAQGTQPDFNSPDSPWKVQAVDLSKYSGTIRARFIGNVTNNSLCDFAIDNVSVVDGSQAAAFDINSATMDACSIFELVNKTPLPTSAAQWVLPGTPGVDYEYLNGTTNLSKEAQVRFMSPGSKNIGLAVASICGRAFKTETITVTPGVAKLEVDVNTLKGTANCTEFQFVDETAIGTTNWTWGVRNANNTTARIGVDYVFINGSERRDQDVDIMFLRDGTFDVEFYANSGCDGSKLIAAKQIVVSPKAAGPATTDATIQGAGAGTVTATGGGGPITWYDAPSGGSVVGTGTSLTQTVNGTTSFYAEEEVGGIGLIITEMNKGNPDYLEVTNASTAPEDFTGWRLVLAQFTVNAVGTYSHRFNGIYAPGQPIYLQENAGFAANIGMVAGSDGWAMIVDDQGNVKDFMVFGLTPAELSQLNIVVPGTSFRVTFADIPWVGPSIPTGGDAHGRIGNANTFTNADWTTGTTAQAGTPRVSNPNLGLPFDGACPSERTAATIFVNNVAPMAILPSNGNDRRTADWSVVEGPWTHYYDDNGTPNSVSDDYRLLSLKLAGQNIGTIGDGTFQVEMASTPAAGTGYALDLTSTAGYLGPNQGALSMNRYWDVTATNQPSQVVGVRFYYNDEDVVDLNATLVQDMNETAVDHTQLTFNKIATNEDPDPSASGHSTVQPGEYINIVHGSAPSTSSWVKGSIRDFHYAEFEVNSFSGGTGGVASGLNAGSLPVELTTFTAEQVNNTALLEWSSAREINTAVYEIERSVDGAVFEVLGATPAAGNSEDVRNYNYTDATPVNGLNYYRLRMIDADGTFNYSEIRTLRFEAEMLTLSAYPNPFATEFTVNFTTEQSGAAYISLFDAAGKEIHTQTIEDVVSGVNTLTVTPANDLPQGVYIMTLRQNGLSQRLQVIKK